MTEDMSYGVIAIYEEDGVYYYLLIQHNAGHWAFPKGHAEGSETPYEAACREFSEETGIYDGIVFKDKSFIEKYSYVRHDKQRVFKTVQYFLARVTNKAVSVQHEEIKAYKWAEFEDATETMTFNEGKRLLREIRHHIENETDISNF